MRVLLVVPDCFGGRGGIARYLQDLVTALAKARPDAELVIYPRAVVDALPPLPPHVTQRSDGVGGKARYGLALAREALSFAPLDLVLVGHVHLVPYAAAFRARAPMAVVLHGEECWAPLGRPVTEALLPLVDTFVAVSHVTVARFAAWTGVPHARFRVLSPGVELGAYGPGDRPAYLVTRYGLAGRRVILTVGRLAANERKGFDPILEALPALIRECPDVIYLVCGDGSDRARLEAKTRDLGLAEHVVFAGYIPDAEKADHYRVADGFALASQGEGFGIVLLEAMASGLPVLGSTRDATREVLRDGRLGVVVDPQDPADVLAGLRRLLALPRGVVPRELAEHEMPAFEARAAALLGELVR
jgi:phosphatidylinositol alpha-1,6-mannosyltransferase